MNALWNKLKASGLVMVCWVLGVITLGIILTNTLKFDTKDVVSKASLAGIGLVLNTIALFNRRRIWIGLMAPLYLIGISIGLFWRDSFDLSVMAVFVSLMILIPITYYSIPKPPKT